MAVRIYISRDAAAQALGADETAAALQVAAAAKGQPITLTRVGSRGMVWLEPLVEVEDAQGRRIAYGPVTPELVPGLVQAGLFEAAPHELRIGRVVDFPYFARQERLTFARVGVTDPVSVDDSIRIDADPHDDRRDVGTCTGSLRHWCSRRAAGAALRAKAGARP